MITSLFTIVNFLKQLAIYLAGNIFTFSIPLGGLKLKLALGIPSDATNEINHVISLVK